MPARSHRRPVGRLGRHAGRFGAVAAVGLAGALLLAACGSDASTSVGPATTVAVDPGCSLSPSAAKDLIGARAAPITPVPLGSAVPATIERCMYQAGRSTTQLAVFSGPAMLAQLKNSILGGSRPAPDVGEGAYCGTNQGTEYTAISCVFLHSGNTNTLSVSVANSDFAQSIEGKVRTLAATLAKRA